MLNLSRSPRSLLASCLVIAVLLLLAGVVTWGLSATLRWLSQKRDCATLQTNADFAFEACLASGKSCADAMRETRTASLSPKCDATIELCKRSVSLQNAASDCRAGRFPSEKGAGR